MPRKSNHQLLEKLGKPGGLADQLRDLRKAAGLTGAALAERTGWNHSKVSKIENANQEPTADDVDAWVDACGGTADDGTHLQTLLADASREVRDHEYALRHGQAAEQDALDAKFQQAARIFNVEMFTIPGLLQTSEYIRHRLLENVDLYGADPVGVDSGIAARMRRQELLYRGDKTFEFVLTQSALNALLCPPDVMRGQLDRLLGLMGSPNVTLGIVPVGNAKLERTLLNGFYVLDEMVFVETYADEHTYFPGSKPHGIYVQVAEDLMDEAAQGGDAVEMIHEAQRRLADT